MSTDATRLNIERAREALAKARNEQVAAAVRAPRPADLSRLQEEEARKQSIDTRAGAFRGQVRERLGLGEYRGPGTPTSAYVSKLMSAPLCDADVCAPVRPAAFEPPAAAQAPKADAVISDTGEDQSSAQGPAYTDDGAPYSPVDLAAAPEAEPAPEPAPEPAAKKRRKFLGIF